MSRNVVVLDTFTGNRHVLTGNDAAIIEAALLAKPGLGTRYHVDVLATFEANAADALATVTDDPPPPS